MDVYYCSLGIKAFAWSILHTKKSAAISHKNFLMCHFRFQICVSLLLYLKGGCSVLTGKTVAGLDLRVKIILVQPTQKHLCDDYLNLP